MKCRVSGIENIYIYIDHFICSVSGKMANRRLSVVKDSSLAATFGNINLKYVVVEWVGDGIMAWVVVLGWEGLAWKKTWYTMPLKYHF